MEILHYLLGLPPVRNGGSVKYALDLAEGEVECGNNVSLLVPGKSTIFRSNKTEIVKKKWKNISCYNIINPLPVTEGCGMKEIEKLYHSGNMKVYIDFLREIKPDIIHVHSFMGLHISFLAAAKQLSIPIVYTSHDYFGICPKGILLQESKLCCLNDGSKCKECIGASVSYYKIWWKQSWFFKKLKESSFVQWLEYSKFLLPIKIFIRDVLKKKNNSRRDGKSDFKEENREYIKLQNYYREMFRYIDAFHFNSKQAKEVYEKYLGTCKGQIIHISNKNITDKRKIREYNGLLKIGYIASLQYFKGFPILRKVLDDLYEEGMHDFVCRVFFNPKDMKMPYIRSYRPYKDEELEMVYENIDVLVLPSVWKETFGLVVLEAISYGVPVIISKNVGAKDILAEKMGIVVCGEDDLKNVIRKIYYNREILKNMNKAICSEKLNLSFEKHVAEMLEFYMKNIRG